MLHKDPVLSLAFSNDDLILASGDRTGLIKIWNLETGKLLKKIENIFQKSIT